MKKLKLLLGLLILFYSCKEDDNVDTHPEENEATTSVVINEFMASNTACCPDPDGTEEYDDWIELYNAGDNTVDIGGWYLSDKADNPQKFQIPATSPAETTIAPGEYLILWADNQPEQGVLHLDFALSADGETITLSTPEGDKADELTFSVQTADVSTGRLPNGTGDLTSMEDPTPGAAN